MPDTIRVESLHLYPLKSGAGIRLETARLENEGFVGDRRMMVVDMEGNCITARKVPKLMQIRTHLDGDEVVLTAPGMPVLAFARNGLSEAGTVTIWGDSVVALDAGEVAARWLSGFLGVGCRLVLKGGRRTLGIGGGGVVSFADTAPLLLTNMASLADLNRFLDFDAEMQRFRPNLVVGGLQPYEEDGWARLRIGDVEFEVAGACDRCIMVTLDPRSGEGRADHEPLAMLGKQRRGEDGKPYFGQFLIPRTLGRLAVGDPVEVLERKAAITILPGPAKPLTRLPALGLASASPGGQGRERLLRCVGITDETHDFRTFRFRVEEGAAVDYKPGQFITLLLDIDGERVRRNYTISSSPSRPHHLSVTVKRVAGGRVSNWMHDTLKPGDTIRALGANGRFHLAEAGETTRLLMLSAGSGITPMMSMLRFIADADLPFDVSFHHSARTARDISFLEELLHLRRQIAGRLKLSWNLTGGATREELAALAARMGGEDAPAFLAGRLDAGMLRHADLSDRLVFCCGPDGFRDAARQLRQSWVPAPRYPFLEETFGADKSSEPLPEIGGYDVSFLKSGKSVAGKGAVTVLELARRAGVPLPADCEAGICGTCRCRVVSGDWRVAANAADPERSALSPDEKQDGYILACSTNPIGAVEIDI